MSKWKKQAFFLSRVNNENEFAQVKVEGMINAGIGIARDVNIHGERLPYSWGCGIYHLDSGLLIVHCRTMARARQKADLLLALTKWTKDAEFLRSLWPLREQVYQIEKS